MPLFWQGLMIHSSMYSYILDSINLFLSRLFLFLINNNCFTSQLLPEYPFLHVQVYNIVLFVQISTLHIPSFKQGQESQGFRNVSHLEPIIMLIFNIHNFIYNYNILDYFLIRRTCNYVCKIK